MKHTKQKTYRTKHFNVVSNSRQGVCMLFDRRGLGLYQSRAHRHCWLVMKDSFTDAINKTSRLIRMQIKTLAEQKQPVLLRSR